MKQIRVEEAVGAALCHDITRIIPGQVKEAQFRKGHVIQAEDIPLLRSMGKEHIYVWEPEPGMIHENDGAARLADLCGTNGFARSGVKEGKIELSAEYDGLFRIDLEGFNRVNEIPDISIAARHSLSPVKSGDKVAGMRVIPLTIPEERLREAERAAGPGPLFELLPYTLKTAGIVITGGEVAHGLIPDGFTPVLTEKLAGYGIEICKRILVGDGVDCVSRAISEVRRSKPDMIICTGGMSVDPDDNTPGAVKQSGADIVSYGAPVLPGSLFLIGYYDDGTPVMGLPGGLLYHKKRGSVFDVILPRIAAGLQIRKKDIVRMGNGGLCLGCEDCHYPICPFGKSGI
jgi:hypothetical protein